MASWHTDHHHHPPGDDQDCCPDEPGVRIRPVTFAELEDYLEQLANPPGPAPLARPRLVGITYGQAGFLDQQGRPGRSAMAEYRRRRAADWQEWKPTLALRIAAVLAAGGSTGLLTAAIAGSSLARLTGLAAAAALGWRLWFRPSSDTLTWRRGAQGERRTARLLAPLERHGYQVFHDLAIPGSAANVDHLVVGPTGLFVIDSNATAAISTIPPAACGMAADPWTAPWRRCGGRPPRSPRPSGSAPTCMSIRCYPVL